MEPITSESFRISSSDPLIPRATVVPKRPTVVLELPFDMAQKLRSLTGSIGLDPITRLVATTQVFPVDTGVEGYTHPRFTPDDVHSVSILIHLALKRVGV